MMNQHQTALFSLLLGSFPNFQSGDGEAALAAYEIVISRSEVCDVEAGVMSLINGGYPGHDGRFAPTAPQLAGAIRAKRDERLDSARRGRAPDNALAGPIIAHDEESRLRVKALVDQFVTKNNKGIPRWQLEPLKRVGGRR